MTLTLSFSVILVLAFLLQSQMTEQLLTTKLNSATEQTANLRQTVEDQIAATDGASSEQSRLDAARTALEDRGATGGSGTIHDGTFDPVLLLPEGGAGSSVSSPEGAEIPPGLVDIVGGDRVAYQYAQVDFRGQRTAALIIGTPIESQIPGTQLYLVYPLTSEEQTLRIMRGAVAAVGIALVLLSAAITWLVTRQTVLPVRQAASIAQQFSDGHLKERMVVRGEDDIARLALSFNGMAESISAQIAQLEEFGSLQRRFTSDVSHELRTPLTTVRMAADMIYGEVDSFEPTTRRAVELLQGELDRFETLLTDLLEVSRYDAGVAELALTSVDLRQCVNSALETESHLAQDAGVTVTTDLPNSAVMAQVDPRRVERILRNLVANAIDHSESKPIIVTMRANSTAVAVSVRDFGVGLKQGELALVFNRFWRADPSRVRRSGGTGLGLAIAREDALLHGGQLDAWGNPGDGACFRLTLPLVAGGELDASPLPLSPGEGAAVAPISQAPASQTTGLQDGKAGGALNQHLRLGGEE